MSDAALFPFEEETQLPDRAKVGMAALIIT